MHAPLFGGNEAEFVAQTIASTMVSSVGAFVDRFEGDMVTLTGAGRAVAVVNGTAAPHSALMLAGVGADDAVADVSGLCAHGPLPMSEWLEDRWSTSPRVSRPKC